MGEYATVARASGGSVMGYLLGDMPNGAGVESCGTFADALADFSEVLRLDPHNGDALLMLGLAAHGMKAHARAVEDFTAAIAHNPADRNAYLVRRRTCEALSESERAAADWGRPGR